MKPGHPVKRRTDVRDLVVGILHPGEMGAAVAGCLTGRGYQVCWASQGRGAATAVRAKEAGLSDVGTAGALAGRSDIVLSICPPHAAADVAGAVAAAGFRGVFVDANAISPAASRALAGVIEAAGASYVDGGIVGGPPTSSSGPRLYLSGARAAGIGDLFAGTQVDARVMDDRIGSASAVKMAYAAWTKGTGALLLCALALADAEGVQDTLLAEWEISQPALPDRAQGAARSAAVKGWRWVAEMEEIAASMAAVGLPPGFHQAAAEVFARPRRAEPGDAVSVEEVIGALRQGPGTSHPGP
jgi:3-hydroxyisobutyrate dehydrogenase-like beta-hydroxyacid dehydrogenase